MSKKMTRIESARTVRDFKGNCGANYDIQCRKCFNYLPTNKCKSNSDTERLIAAQTFIKRHNQKSKRKPKPVIAKTTPTRPNFRQALKDKKEFYVAVTPELSEELQKVAFECGVCWRNETSGVVHTDKKWLNFESLGWFGYSSEPFYKTEYLPESDTFKEPVTRSNFRQALKDKKEFYVAVTPELSEELQKVAFECGAKWMGNPDLIQVTGNDFLIFEFSVAKQNAYHIYASNIIIDHKAEHTEYDPTTDTFKEPESIGTVPDVEWFECIDIGGVSGKNLSYHKKYKVIGRDDDMVTIVNDKGKEERVWASRFIPTTDTFKEPEAQETIGNPSDEADELPECIKITDPVPEFCYHITQKAIKWNRCKFITEKTFEGETTYILLEHGGIRSFGDETYRSLDDAVAVLKSREVK